jgi:TM2 domain-containing membrane protein YozV
MKNHSKINLILGFIANFIIPGAGTIIFGHYELGILQMSLFVAGILIMLSKISDVLASIIVLPLIMLWIWALITSIREKVYK